MKSIILTSKSNEAEQLKTRLAELDQSFVGIESFTKETLTPEMDCEYIFSTWYMPKFSRDEIKLFFPNLKAVFYAAGTVKQFAIPFLESGIRVFSSAQANGVPVAEFATGQIILANKGYFQSQKKFRWPIWRRGFAKARKVAENHSGNYGKTVGILGCGAIGSSVVKLLKSYDLSIKVYDPYMTSERARELGVSIASLEEIFSTSNVISNHMPDIEETKGIIDEKLLRLLPPSATLINTGRGAQIKENDLAKVLKVRPDLTALLDVTMHEPPYPWSSLYRRSNIFITPHIAGSLSGEINRMIDYAYSSYLDIINGRASKGEILINELKHMA